MVTDDNGCRNNGPAVETDDNIQVKETGDNGPSTPTKMIMVQQWKQMTTAQKWRQMIMVHQCQQR